MISQVSSVSFLVYTLLFVELWSTESWRCDPKTVGMLRDIRGVKYHCLCNTNGNLPEAANFQNCVLFAPPNAVPSSMPPGANAPLYPLPAATDACSSLHQSTFKRCACQFRRHLRSAARGDLQVLTTRTATFAVSVQNFGAIYHPHSKTRHRHLHSLAAG